VVREATDRLRPSSLVCPLGIARCRINEGASLVPRRGLDRSSPQDGDREDAQPGKESRCGLPRPNQGYVTSEIRRHVSSLSTLPLGIPDGGSLWVSPLRSIFEREFLDEGRGRPLAPRVGLVFPDGYAKALHTDWPSISDKTAAQRLPQWGSPGKNRVSPRGHPCLALEVTVGFCVVQISTGPMSRSQTD